MDPKKTSKAVLWVGEQSASLLKKSSTTGKIIAGIFLSGFALLIVALLIYSVNRYGKRLAKALHERDVLKEREKRAKVAKKVLDSEEKIRKKDQEIRDLVDKQFELLEEEKKYRETLRLEREKIDAIENWKDMDAYLAERPDFEERLRRSASGD